LYVQHPCKPYIEDYTQIIYMNYEGDIPSFQSKMGISGTLTCTPLVVDISILTKTFEVSLRRKRANKLD
jgi:hypothetical protein